MAIFIPGQLNPVSPSNKTPVARRDTITDNPNAVLRKLLASKIAPDKFEGVSTYRAVVLATFNEDQESSPLWKMVSTLAEFAGVDTFDQPQFFICMIPELHAHLPSPFDYAPGSPEFTKASIRYPIYEMSQQIETVDSEALIGVEIGSIVEVTFADSDMSKGYVSRLVMPGNLGESGASSEGSARSSHGSGNTHTPPRTDMVCSLSSADNATAEEIFDAYSENGMSMELANKIVEVAESLYTNSAWLANAIFFESGYTFRPDIRHPGSGATGLIQFMDKTAKELGTTTATLAKMSAVEQMDWVEKYFRLDRVGGYWPEQQYQSQADIFMAIYFPIAIGQGPDFNIYEWYKENRPSIARKYYRQNRGTVTAGDYAAAANRRAKLEC